MREVIGGQEFYFSLAALSGLWSVLPVSWCGQVSFTVCSIVVYASFIC